MSTNSPLPENAIYAGHFIPKESDDSLKLYVCRAFFQGDLLPGKFCPDMKEAWICYLGDEHVVWVSYECQIKEAF